MTSPTPNLEASATFNVSPVRSQVVLGGLVFFAIVALCIGGGLLALNNDRGWFFAGFSGLLCFVVIWCWLRSQRDSDLADGHPTKVELANGAKISMDGRLHSSPEEFQRVGLLIQTLALRQPLPEPDGLVGNGGVPVLNSKSDAQELVARINVDVQNMHDMTMAQLREHLSGQSVLQVPGDGEGPSAEVLPERDSLNSSPALESVAS